MMFHRNSLEDTEDRTVLRAQSGDRAALDRLLEKYEVPLFHHIHRMLRDEQATYDTLQETFIAAAVNIQKLRERSKFKAWLYGTASRIALRNRKRAAKQSERECPETQQSVKPVALESLLKKEQVRSMTREIDFLSLPLRSVVLLHYFEEFTLLETAKALEIPLGTVKSRLAAALGVLRERLNGATRAVASANEKG